MSWKAGEMDGTPDGQREPSTNGEMAAAISTAVVHSVGASTGRGPTKARTYLNTDAITVVLQDTLTKGERNLVSTGNASTVLATRALFQAMMREELVTTVERLTGRTVAAFMSANHIDPDMAVETFVLDPEPETADEQPRMP